MSRTLGQMNRSMLVVKVTGRDEAGTGRRLEIAAGVPGEGDRIAGLNEINNM